MSVEVISRVFKFSKSKAGDRVIMLALADRASDEGLAWPGIPELARKANETERGVQLGLARLVAMGELVIIQSLGGRANTNLYLVTVGLSPESVTDIQRYLEIGQARHAAWVNSVARKNGESRFTVKRDKTHIEQINGESNEGETVNPDSPESLFKPSLKTIQDQSHQGLKEILSEVIEGGDQPELVDLALSSLMGISVTVQEIQDFFGAGGYWWDDGHEGRKPRITELPGTIARFRRIAWDKKILSEGSEQGGQ